MAIDAKLNFISRMQKEIGGMVTADAMPRIMSAVSDLLDGYEMREISAGAAEDQSDLLSYYLGAMRVQGRSTKTIERYEFMLKRMLRGVGTGCRMITVHHLRAYLAQEKARGLQDSTLESMRQIYSAFFGWLHREGLIDKNPIANLGPIKVAKKKRTEYTAVELERLEPNGVRYMLTQLAARAGVENVHPHRFRRTLATKLARKGMPVQEVAAVLGHEKIDTTMRYVVQNSEDISHDYRRYAS